MSRNLPGRMLQQCGFIKIHRSLITKVTTHQRVSIDQGPLWPASCCQQRIQLLDVRIETRQYRVRRSLVCARGDGDDIAINPELPDHDSAQTGADEVLHTST